MSPPIDPGASDALAFRIKRNDLFIKVGTCAKCERRGNVTPKPGKGPIPNQLMVIADTPTMSGTRPYLDQKLKNAGLPALSKWFVTSTVRCGGDAPDNLDIMLCLDNLRSEINLVDPKWILLLGSHALTAVGLGKNQITKCHGRPFRCPAGPFIGRWCFPTFHPAVAYKNDHNANLLTADLSTMYGLLSGRVNLSSIEARVGRAGKLNLNVEGV